MRQSQWRILPNLLAQLVANRECPERSIKGGFHIKHRIGHSTVNINGLLHLAQSFRVSGIANNKQHGKPFVLFQLSYQSTVISTTRWCLVHHQELIRGKIRKGIPAEHEIHLAIVIQHAFQGA